jgi:hypothetical protein
MALLTSACSGPAPESVAQPSSPAVIEPTLTSSARPSGTPPRVPRPFRAVPEVTGLTLSRATALIEEAGFRARARTIAYSACVEDTIVLRQSPRPGSKRETGGRVTLGITNDPGGPCGLGLPPASAALDAAGGAFVGFARGEAPAAELFASDVGLHLGGRLLHTIPGARAGFPRSYGTLCPNAGSYSARSCPFSATRAIADYPGPMAITSEPPQGPCIGAESLAGRFSRTVTLTPDEPRSCVDYFAVELAVDAAGRIVAVNLIWAQP